MIKVVTIFVAGVVAVVVAYVWSLQSRYGDAFERTSLGATEADLRTAAGSPSYETNGTRSVEPGYAKPPDQHVPGCVKELWYAMPWPMPHRFSYCFDQHGVLVHKYNWVSW